MTHRVELEPAAGEPPRLTGYVLAWILAGTAAVSH